jgi:hypothetical protein
MDYTKKSQAGKPYDFGRLHIGKSIDVEFLVKGLDTWFSVWYCGFEDISTAELAIWRLARKEF